MRYLVSTLLLLFAIYLPAHAESPRVQLETSMGTLTIELDQEKAPLSVANFLEYVDSGFYDGTVFHRVIDGFMIQGGGFDTNLQRKQTRDPIQNEAANGLKNYRYTIAMARTQAPHSATSQFFINTEDNDFLNHRAPSGNGWGYAVFGKLVGGEDIVDEISTVETGQRGILPGDVPLQNITIIKASRLSE
ncbi:MAG: peptidylprolyl isomerase [Pseudomonadota bacterium]